MSNVMIAVFTVLAGVIGGCLVIFYQIYVRRKQEKTIVHLYSLEFLLLFSRCAMYYDQMLKPAISFSTLFETTDSGTALKLAEVRVKPSILDTIIKLKANFFQVIRYAHLANRIDPETKKLVTDQEAQGRAVVFFMGDRHLPDGSFGRNRYKKDYKKKIEEVLNHLEYLHTCGHHDLIRCLERLIKKIRKIDEILDHLGYMPGRYDKLIWYLKRLTELVRRLISTCIHRLEKSRKNRKYFIDVYRKELDERETELDDLRIREKNSI